MYSYGAGWVDYEDFGLGGFRLDCKDLTVKRYLVLNIVLHHIQFLKWLYLKPVSLHLACCSLLSKHKSAVEKSLQAKLYKDKSTKSMFNVTASFFRKSEIFKQLKIKPAKLHLQFELGLEVKWFNLCVIWHSLLITHISGYNPQMCM